MILLILFDAYIILGTICAVMNYIGVFDPDIDASDFGKLAAQQRLIYRSVSPYVVLAITTMTWLPSLIISTIQYARWKHS